MLSDFSRGFFLSRSKRIPEAMTRTPTRSRTKKRLVAKSPDFTASFAGRILGRMVTAM
jgi:hypothetical protein